jgi:hypothetical protein
MKTTPDLIAIHPDTIALQAQMYFVGAGKCHSWPGRRTPRFSLRPIAFQKPQMLLSKTSCGSRIIVPAAS